LSHMITSPRRLEGVTVRVRFAPSPTGMFHVGSARVALQNWVFAKQQGGTFVLRIEDTDASRSKPEWTEGILAAMAWLGMTSDQYEGPYLQSEFAAEHRAAVEKLANSGYTYYCDCTREAIQERTGSQYRGYDGFCRDRGLSAGPGRALRFRTPGGLAPGAARARPGAGGDLLPAAIRAGPVRPDRRGGRVPAMPVSGRRLQPRRSVRHPVRRL